MNIHQPSGNGEPAKTTGTGRLQKILQLLAAVALTSTAPAESNSQLIANNAPKVGGLGSPEAPAGQPVLSEYQLKLASIFDLTKGEVGVDARGLVPDFLAKFDKCMQNMAAMEPAYLQEQWRLLVTELPKFQQNVLKELKGKIDQAEVDWKNPKLTSSERTALKNAYDTLKADYSSVYFSKNPEGKLLYVPGKVDVPGGIAVFDQLKAVVARNGLSVKVITPTPLFNGARLPLAPTKALGLELRNAIGLRQSNINSPLVNPKVIALADSLINFGLEDRVVAAEGVKTIVAKTGGTTTNIGKTGDAGKLNSKATSNQPGEPFITTFTTNEGSEVQITPVKGVPGQYEVTPGSVIPQQRFAAQDVDLPAGSAIHVKTEGLKKFGTYWVDQNGITTGKGELPANGTLDLPNGARAFYISNIGETGGGRFTLSLVRTPKKIASNLKKK